jgi:hypothetical protein
MPSSAFVPAHALAASARLPTAPAIAAAQSAACRARSGAGRRCRLRQGK